MQTRRHLLESFAAAGLSATIGKASAQAQETIRIGFSAPLSGPFAINGNQMVAALKLFIEQNGTNLTGKKIELIVRDDAGVPDQAKRIAQELVVNSKVAILAGYNFTPVALALASISAEAKIPGANTARKAPESVMPYPNVAAAMRIGTRLWSLRMYSFSKA